MTVRICDRCGDITVDSESCTCATPYESAEPGRRHRAAVEAARITSNHNVSTPGPGRHQPRPQHSPPKTDALTDLAHQSRPTRQQRPA
jgi:hypothetical protein